MFPLASGEQKTGLTLNLTPQGIISGRVFDEQGDPLQTAQVQLYQRRKMAGQVRWMPLHGNTTNDRGEYRILNLGAGEYVVCASYINQPVQMNPSAQVRPQVYATVYYPDGRDLNSAKAVVVRKGGELAGIDLRLRKEPAYRVRVRVEGVSGDMLQQTHVSIVPRDLFAGFGAAGMSSRQLEPGLFELTAPAGLWLVRAQTAMDGGESRIGTTPIEVTTADLAEVVVVRVAEIQMVTGTLLLEGASDVKMSWNSFNLRLVRMDGTSFNFGRSMVTEDGAFTVHNNVPGKYLLEVHGPQPEKSYLASIKIGNEEYLGREIDLTVGAPGPVQVLYRNDGAKVSGRVEGEAGEIGMVVLVPVETHLRRMEYMPATRIRPAGSFAFPPVRPGEYLVCHFVGSFQTLVEEGEPPKESMAAAVRLEVEASGEYAVTVKAVWP